MTKPKFGRSWITLGFFLGVVGISVGACTKVEEDNGDSGTDGNESGRGGGSASKGGASAGKSPAKSSSSSGNSAGNSNSSGSSVSGGASSSSSYVPSGPVSACEGIVTTKDQVGSVGEVCNGESVESEPAKADMVILMDRSSSNGYAVNTDEPIGEATDGKTSRWDVLTAAMRALATASDTGDMQASLTFFNLDGSLSDSADTNCNATKYETPIVALGPLSETGKAMVTAMEGIKPGGFTPTVPALTGALRYAMKLKKEDPTREKVVVMISDGYPTICPQRSALDVRAVMAEAAAAEIPIKTYVIGVGAPDKLDGALMNLNGYATAGRTGEPILIDEATEDPAKIQSQLVNALRNISSDPLSCSYQVSPPNEGYKVDPERVTMTFQPEAGNFQEIPKVSGPTGCATSVHGGWFFDNETNPTRITVCPCTCAAFGAGQVQLVYGCQPKLEIQ